MELRPSSAGRWVACPASPALEAPFPNASSEAAREGTAAHWVAEQVLKGASLSERAPNNVHITAEMLSYVGEYVEHVRNVIIGSTAGFVIEHPVALGCGVKGSCDAACLDGGHLHLWDLKYGWSLVEAAGNWQLVTYAIGLYEQYCGSIDKVTMHIVQPRPSHPEGRVRSWTLTIPELDEYRAKLYAAAELARRPGPPYPAAATGSHCRYCRALHVCPAAQAAAMNAIDVSESGVPHGLSTPSVASELRTLYRAEEALKLRKIALEGQAIAALKTGGIVPGYSLQQAKGHRKFRDVSDIPPLEALTGLSLSESAPVTPAEAKRRGMSEEILLIYTEKPETGLKLVAVDPSHKAKEIFG